MVCLRTLLFASHIFAGDAARTHETIKQMKEEEEAADFLDEDASGETNEFGVVDGDALRNVYLLGANISDANDGAPKNYKWPRDLNSKYRNKRRLRCGANGCGFLVTSNKPPHKEMVVKVAQHSLKVECGWMRTVRMEGCRDAKVLELLETYVPTCDDMGQTSEGLHYLAQPMAGSRVLMDKVPDGGGRHSLSLEDEKTIAAQLVAGVYAMHKVGYWHNDLAGGNIVLNWNRIALIDLGLVTSTRCRTQRCRGAYSRDGNAIFRWLSNLAQCRWNARWQHGQWWAKANPRGLKANQDRALECIQQRWEPDEKFMTALRRVFDANVKEALPEQHITELYDTRFVTENLPENDHRFQIPETEGCENWSSDQIRDKLAAFGGSRHVTL